MKNWIKVIFALNNKLDALTYSIDGQVDCLSKVISGNTLELFDSIMKLNDKKIRLINMRVLHDKMREALSDREYEIILKLARGRSFAEIADELELSKGTVYRVYSRAANRLIRLLKYYGYSAEKFDEDYSDVLLVKKTYKKLARMYGAM